MDKLFFNPKTTQKMKKKGNRSSLREKDNKYESKYLVGGSAAEERNKQREREREAELPH
jgi:hypothetical protein